MTAKDKQAMVWANERAHQLARFYRHLLCFLLVGAGLVVIDIATGGEGRLLGLDWAFWPIGGWAIGLLGHGLSTFRLSDSKGWEARKAQQLYEGRRDKAQLGEGG